MDKEEEFVVKKFIQVENFYDSDKNLVKGTPLSVVNGIQDVNFVTLKIGVINVGSNDITARIIEVTPLASQIEFSQQEIEVKTKKSQMFSTGFVDVTPFEGLIQDFCMTLELKSLATGNTERISSCVGVDIRKDGSIFLDTPAQNNNGEVNLDCQERWACTGWSSCDIQGIQRRQCTDINTCGTTQNIPLSVRFCDAPRALCEEAWSCGDWFACSNGVQTRDCGDLNECITQINRPSERIACDQPKPCDEQWTCTNWGSCLDDNQQRTCTDINQCGTQSIKPPQSRSCLGPDFETNAVGGDYFSESVFVTVNGITYGFSSVSSYRCDPQGSQIITKSPEGFLICSREGYSITQRIYVDDSSQSGLFKV